jgi:S1/P1 Nuclease
MSVRLLFVLLCLLPVSPVFAWGSTGHRVVGLIAERHLSPQAKAAVADLLAGETLARVGFWADEIKSDPAWEKASPWHYVNIADAAAYETAPKSSKGDVIEAIVRFEAVLRDRGASRLSRAEALKFLVHFVGDVHQPFHVGRAEDRGGNEILVTWHDEVSNLHAVWDSDLIESTGLSYTELADFIDRATPDEVRALQASDVFEWARESQALRPTVYAIGDGRLGYTYSYRVMPIVERRLREAGVRLAGLLNRVFKTE